MAQKFTLSVKIGQASLRQSAACYNVMVCFVTLLNPVSGRRGEIKQSKWTLSELGLPFTLDQDTDLFPTSSLWPPWSQPQWTGLFK